MNILEDIGGKLEENDLIFREGDKEIGGTTLADRVADSFAPSDRDVVMQICLLHLKTKRREICKNY